MKVDILVIGAHPDDVELGCGGTIIKEVQKGRTVAVIDLTRGELGTRGTYKSRDSETKLATEILGVQFRENMNFKDGFFENNTANKLALIKKIRKYKPDIVITNAIEDRHPDHSRASQLTVDSCFLSGLEKINTKQDIWRPRAIYHYIQFNNIIPDFVVDISNQMTLKLRAVKAYKSQFFDPDSTESKTIISSKDFLNSITYRASDLGRQNFCDYAEGFIANQILKVDSLIDLK